MDLAQQEEIIRMETDGYGAGGGGYDKEPGHKGVIILDFIRDN